MIKYILYFFIYALLGWICEVIYCYIPKKKFQNRGFLYAPICPIYGFGALGILLPLYLVKPDFDYNLGDIWLVLIAGFFISSILEYITSYVMEKLFHMRWWDYSHYKFNINGRVCLLNSSLFTLLTILIVYLGHPLVIKFVELFPDIVCYIASIILVLTFIFDTTMSCIRVGKFNKAIEKLHNVKEDLIVFKEKLKNNYSLLHPFKGLVSKFPKLQSLKYSDAKERFDAIKERILSKKKK